MLHSKLLTFLANIFSGTFQRIVEWIKRNDRLRKLLKWKHCNIMLSMLSLMSFCVNERGAISDCVDVCVCLWWLFPLAFQLPSTIWRLLNWRFFVSVCVQWFGSFFVQHHPFGVRSIVVFRWKQQNKNVLLLSFQCAIFKQRTYTGFVVSPCVLVCAFVCLSQSLGLLNRRI